MKSFGPSLESDWKDIVWMEIRIRVSLGKTNQNAKMQISAAAGGKNVILSMHLEFKDLIMNILNNVS